jgi:Flp pilus assembly protein TadG
MFIRLRQLLRRGRGQEGAAAVEFALLLLPLVLLIGGGVDFGHAYYIQHVITTASREGARYGVKYQVNSSTGLPVAPSALPTSISNYVKLPQPAGLGYAGLLGSDANLTVTPGGPGYTSNTVGAILTVTVTADKHWFFLGGLLGFPNPKTLTATAAMTLER